MHLMVHGKERISPESKSSKWTPKLRWALTMCVTKSTALFGEWVLYFFIPKNLEKDMLEEKVSRFKEHL